MPCMPSISRFLNMSSIWLLSVLLSFGNDVGVPDVHDDALDPLAVGAGQLHGLFNESIGIEDVVLHLVRGVPKSPVVFEAG